MRTHIRLPISVLRAVVAAATFVAPAVALAQEGSPMQPNLTRVAPAWLGFIFMVLLLALVVGVSLMPSKRGHQD